MNHPFRTFIAALALSLAACQSPAQVPRDITLKITDETGRPVVGGKPKGKPKGTRVDS